ncbi:MAG: pyruvate dehydrogenase (acetyl-transferring) E1 component subunit alpha, partial [Candidatus Carbobacillus altaicus]|nr:pyruvate dehydrogenase (acetyl-transferring) E1 component subunit alpha [Candidatus Carbobacillus altaicus]
PEGKLKEGEMINDFSADDLRRLMHRMVFTRIFDTRAVSLAKQGRLGFYAPVAGQEATMVGSVDAMEDADWLIPSYRDLPQLIFRGYPLEQAFLFSRGHQGGFAIPEGVRALGPQIIIGAQIVQAAGIALGLKLRQDEGVAVAFIGDGGTSQGDFYEGLNTAAVYDAPLIVIVQNNGYAISVPVSEQTKAKTLAQKAIAFGIPGRRIDGMDVLAVVRAVREALKLARGGAGPVLIEAVMYRYGPHTMSGDDPTRYREARELSEWEQRDPLLRFRTFLTEQGLWDEKKEKEVIEESKEAIAQALAKAEAAPKMTVETLVASVYR